MISHPPVVDLSLRRLDVDRWVVAYLLMSGMLPLLNPSVLPNPVGNLALHCAMALAVWFIPPWLRGRRLFPARLLGEIYVPMMFPFFYGEMKHLGIVFFPFERSLDPALIKLEEAIFGCQPSLEWSRWWPWPWFHELMEFAYFSYYFLALAFVILAFKAGHYTTEERWEKVRDFVRDLGVVMLICYTCYTFFPAWGPKYFRAGFIAVDGWIFTDIMLYIHNNGALLGAAFPSSHVAASMVPWWHTWKSFPEHRGWMTVIFLLLCMSTVYNRYHYVIDVYGGWILAGLVMFFLHHHGDKARQHLARIIHEGASRG